MNMNLRRTYLMMLSYVSIIAFTAALIFCIVRIQQVSAELDKRSYDTSWALIQLQHEMGRFLSTIELYYLNRATREDLNLRYDILWSRLPVLMSGKLQESISEQYRVYRLVERIHDRVVNIEPTIVDLTPYSENYVQVLIELSPLLEPLTKSVASTFQGNTMSESNWDVRLSGLRNALLAVIAGLLTSISFLIYLSRVEHRENFIASHHDALTGLKNRLSLMEFMEESSRKENYFCLLMLDIRSFSLINSHFGYEVGNTILKSVAQRLRERFSSPQYEVARVSGDQFAIVQRGVVKIAEVRTQVEEIKHIIQKSIVVDKHNFKLDPSMGVAYYPSDANQPGELISRAESALALCKEKNNYYAIFDRSFIKEMHRRKRIAQDLDSAIEAHLIEPYYQPIIDLQTGKCTSLEALVRWQHPDLGLIPPNELIEIADEYEMAPKLGGWLLQAICTQLVQWQELGFHDLQVAFNVSPGMYKRSLLKMVAETLLETKLPAKNLILEITEDTSISQVETSMHLMADLYRQGIELALDDFGMGYSSLSYLQKLPVSRLKIDKSFVTHISDSEESRDFYYNIMNMAKILNKKIICEGIESYKQLRQIQESGCHAYGQGYLFSRPLPAVEVLHALQSQENWIKDEINSHS